MLTLIIPAFNEQKYLPRVLRTLNNQTDTDFTLLLVDNLSTDNTKAIMQNFAQNSNIKKVRVISVNKIGKINAMRVAIKDAKQHGATVVAASDADALFSKNWTKRVKDTIAKNPKADFGFSNELFNRKELKHHPNFLMALDQFTAWRNHMRTKVGGYVIMNNAWYKISAFEAVGGFDDSWTQSEDTLLTLRFISHGYHGIYFKAPVIVSSRRLLDKDNMQKWCLEESYRDFITVGDGITWKPIRFTSNTKQSDVSVELMNLASTIKSKRIMRRLLILSFFESSNKNTIKRRLKRFFKKTNAELLIEEWIGNLPMLQKEFSKYSELKDQYETLNQHLKDNYQEIISVGGKVIEHCLHKNSICPINKGVHDYAQEQAIF
jgi:glycosyltransferase involved in cell wall biosynthesis